MAFVNRGVGTPLTKCPHMTARCPHFKIECKDPVSIDCHYIKRTTASLFTTALSLRALGSTKLSEAGQKYLKDTEVFLQEQIGTKYGRSGMVFWGDREQGEF